MFDLERKIDSNYLICRSSLSNQIFTVELIEFRSLKYLKVIYQFTIHFHITYKQGYIYIPE